MIAPFTSAAARGCRLGGMAVMIICMAASAGLALPALAAKTHTIAMDGTRFIPDTLTVQRGDLVVWVNKDPFPHTATADGLFDSKSIAAGHSWSHVVRKSGELSYVCTLHPGMRGTLVVHD
jgi:plastocyanin